MAQAHGVDGKLDVAERLFTATNASKEIADDATCAFIGGDRLGGARYGFVAFHLHVGLARLAMGDLHPVGVNKFEVGALVSLSRMVNDLLRLQLADVHGEGRAAEMVRAPVGNFTARIVPVGTPGVFHRAEVSVAA